MPVDKSPISNLYPSGRVLALDVGERRIGAAVSDPSGTLASPHSVIRRRSKAEDFEAVDRLVKELGVQRVVVGLPLSLNGEMGPQARRVSRYARALAQALDVPVELYDESYSTLTAEELLSQNPSKHRQVPIDAAAAAVILQEYLESQRERRRRLTHPGTPYGRRSGPG
jgi:putative Holliday junction resolvase